MESRIIVASVLATATFFGAHALDIELTPGALAAQIVKVESTDDSSLRLAGTADASDLSLLHRTSRSVRSLDLSDLRIVACSYTRDGYMDRMDYKEGELVPYMIAGTEITAVILPSAPSLIGSSAFALSKLESVEIPAAVSEVGDYAFADAAYLKSVKFSGKMPAAGKGVFRNCTSLSSVTCDAPMQDIGDGMFYNCRSLVRMPEGARNVGNEAFMKSGLVSVELEEGASVGDYAFAEIPTLRTVRAGGSVKFGKGVFHGDTGLDDLPEWSAAIPELTAAGSGVVLAGTVDVPVVGAASFANNAGITSLRFGPNVESIEADAFRNCTGILNVDVRDLQDRIPRLDPEAFSGLENDEGKYPVMLVTTDASRELWRNADVWKKFDIRSTATGSDLIPATSEPVVSLVSGRLSISSPVPMEHVLVAGVSGIKYYDGGRGLESIEIPVPESEPVVVRVVVGGVLRVYKLG